MEIKNESVGQKQQIADLIKENNGLRIHVTALQSKMI